jgi:phage host-nuclease inhibitor protein Gam
VKSFLQTRGLRRRGSLSRRERKTLRSNMNDRITSIQERRYRHGAEDSRSDNHS